MTYVLILLVTIYLGTAGGPAMHEFYSKAACEDAGLAAKKAFEDTGKATLVAWKCVPKGG
ncbi:hypothetical protein FJY93_05140 [Candidatus Kaiserbacteria bacterium]|nr:hypothetical protein [Candidatus Kaiserbacteria bacterium]